MTPQYLLTLLRAEPFTPFRVHGADGRTWDVREPCNAGVIRTHAALPVWGGDLFPERAELVALDRIARIEIPITTQAGIPA